GHHHVKRADPIGGDDQQIPAKVINIAHFSPVHRERQVRPQQRLSHGDDSTSVERASPSAKMPTQSAAGFMPITFEIYCEGTRLMNFGPAGEIAIGPESVRMPGAVRFESGLLTVQTADEQPVRVALLWDLG